MSFIDWRGPEKQEVVDKGLIKGDRALTIPETGFKWHNTLFHKRLKAKAPGSCANEAWHSPGHGSFRAHWGSLVHCQGQGNSVWDEGSLTARLGAAVGACCSGC